MKLVFYYEHVKPELLHEYNNKQSSRVTHQNTAFSSLVLTADALINKPPGLNHLLSICSLNRERINKLLTLIAVQNGVHIICDQNPPFVRNSMVAWIFILKLLIWPKKKKQKGKRSHFSGEHSNQCMA